MRARWALSAAALVLAACGTTLPRSAFTGSGSSDGSSGGLAIAPSPSSLSSSPASSPLSTTGGTDIGGAEVPPPAASSMPAATVGQADSTSTMPALSSGAAGPQSGYGFTAKTIDIGIYTLNGFSGLASSLGVKSLETGNQVAMAQSVIAYINAHGGMAGRKVVGVFHDFSVANASSPGTEAQAGCAAFTQDAHVFAVASIVGGLSSSFYQCMQDHGVIVSTTGEYTTPATFRQFPNLYQPVDIDYTRLFTDMVPVLVAAGWFGPSSKIGVIGVDIPASTDAIDEGLKPALHAAGLKLDDQFIEGTDLTSSETEPSSAVLRFKADGITNVLFSADSSALTFAQAAQNQAYHPKYELDSRQDPGATLESNLPASQLNGSFGMGWIPAEDLDAAQAASVITPGLARCKQALGANAQNLGVGSTLVTATWTCDNLFFLKAVLDAVTSLTPAAFAAAATHAGFQPSSTYASHIKPGAPEDGASEYRTVAYVTSCGCFRYTGPLTPF